MIAVDESTLLSREASHTPPIAAHFSVQLMPSSARNQSPTASGGRGLGGGGDGLGGGGGMGGMGGGAVLGGP